MIAVDTVSGFFNSAMGIVADGDWGVDDNITEIFILGANIALDGPP